MAPVRGRRAIPGAYSAVSQQLQLRPCGDGLSLEQGHDVLQGVAISSDWGSPPWPGLGISEGPL